MTSLGRTTHARTSSMAEKAHDAHIDEKLVREAVAHIRKSLAETLFKGAVVVGDYVLERFFDGDPARVSSRSSYKSASFRALAARCNDELPISKSWLNAAVGIAVMRRLLPRGAVAFQHLPTSHQAALLPLRDPAKVARLAERAFARRLPVRTLRELVFDEVARSASDDERRGRPPTPRILKTLHRSLRVFTLEGGKRSFTKAMVDELTEAQAADALRAAESLKERLDDLAEKLRVRARPR